MTVRFGTFDAESWWRPDDLAVLPSVGGGDPAVDTMDELLAGFCAPGDVLITRRPMDPEILAGYGVSFDHKSIDDAGSGPIERHLLDDPLLADGPLEPYAVLAPLAGLPSPEVVAKVNSKTWSNELVTQLGLPGAGRVVRSVDELVAAVTDLDFRTLIKDPYGVSGRALLEVTTPGVLRAIERVLRKQTGQRIELLVQQKYPKAHDFSGHLHVRRDGSWEFLGLQQLTNKGFRHFGSSPAPAALIDQGWYAESLAEVVAAISTAGYWGPVGIDAMLLDDGSVVPVLEINARQSLGLLALQLDRRADDLTAHLWQLELNLSPGKGIRDVLHALNGCLSSGDRPGALVLNGSHLTAPGGRVYVAIFCRAGELAQWQHRLLAAVTAAGLTPRGRSDAA
ncbi:hypothetical protein BWI15_18725 [Kribbella sp. ALI-6-A]|uniref:hypothetical protein n=1 Tax=Kribbella sp. ALI-6-A TaxID=1933817 RepID=UPI00097C97B1|nr:hypothetical protein [Kribbella sp. ALI-6-A]ONI72114.1 hypothetical protein BWI15_18725 [Kribbella sp. ALI-6-A]